MKRRLLEWIWALRRRMAGSARATPPPTARETARVPEWTTTIALGDASIGHGYLERWRLSENVLVTPRGGDGTSLRLFSCDAPETPVATHPHVILEARNLVVDFGRIGTRDELESRPDYQRVRGGYLDYRAGALGAVAANLGNLPPESLPRDHLRDAFASLEPIEDARSADRTVEECCLFIAREPREYENLFHAHTDWLAAYFAVRLLGLEDVAKRVVFLDPHPRGSLDEAAASMFSPSAAVGRRADFRSERIRFRHAAFVPPGYSSVLWARQHEVSPAPPVGLLQDYGRFFRSAFSSRPPFVPGAPVRVILLSRRPYPGRGPALLRQFRSDEDLATALRSIPGVVVEVVDPATLSFGDQVRVAASAEILVGAHGAGLAHAFAIADHGALVEVVAAPAASTYRLYANLAGWTHRLYARLEAPERLGFGGSWLDPDPLELKRCVLELAARVRERRPSS